MVLDAPLTVALLALIATIDLAQFAVTLDHRGRLARVEEGLEAVEKDDDRLDVPFPRWGW